MKESIANSYIFGIVIIFVGIIMLFFVASLNYTKAFKVKNKIINLIEINGEYNGTVKKQIDSALSDIGYRIDDSGKCDPNGHGRFEGSELLTTHGNVNYRYCVYRFDQGEKGAYYGVVTYMYFEVPLIGQMLEFPVYGETKTMGLLG